MTNAYQIFRAIKAYTPYISKGFGADVGFGKLKGDTALHIYISFLKPRI